MNDAIDPNSISVRDLSEEDIQPLLDYWYRSPKGFIEAMGVDTQKMLPEKKLEQDLRDKISQNSKLKASKLNALIITYNGRAIGQHTLNPLVENDHGIFHAHIWEPSLRRRGIGLHSYPRACGIFMDRFQLKRILFKTPVQNTGSLRVKEKLGIPCIGQEVVDFGIVKAGTLAHVFELKKEDFGL